MAELTKLEAKLGEVIGLAMGAQEATDKVSKVAEKEQDDEFVKALAKMREEAKETEERGTELAGSFEGKKTAILEEARETKSKAQEMMKTYLDRSSDTLDGFEFLTMAEAGEVGHWEILGTLSSGDGGHPDVQRLVDWALPIQQRHQKTVREACLQLASTENPADPA